MKKGLIAVLLLLTLIAGQSVAQRKHSSKPAATTSRKPAPTSVAKAPPVPYSVQPLDQTVTNLGPNFRGHDIRAIVQAIKDAPALKEKSEFESSSDYEARKVSFPVRPLYGGILPSSHVAFVLEEKLPGPEFKYDADSQTLAVTVPLGRIWFYSDKNDVTLDGIVVQSRVIQNSSYVGTNAYGAKVDVDKTYGEDFGVAFPQNGWLSTSTDGYRKTFRYLIAMSPNDAKALKVDGKVLLICKLREPWYRHTVHGHEATISEPYDIVYGDNYLQADPEQVWIFHQQTGEVVAKASPASFEAGGDQLAIKLRETPLLLEVSSSGHTSANITVDDGKPTSLFISQRQEIGAKHKIVVELSYPSSLSNIQFKLNGKAYTPNWVKDSTSIGTYESIRSAKFVITAP